MKLELFELLSCFSHLSEDDIEIHDCQDLYFTCNSDLYVNVEFFDDSTEVITLYNEFEGCSAYTVIKMSPWSIGWQYGMDSCTLLIKDFPHLKDEVLSFLNDSGLSEFSKYCGRFLET